MNSTGSAMRSLYMICIVVLIFVCAGCAASSTTIIEEEVVTNPKPMYSYRSIVIRDLELNGERHSGYSEPTSKMDEAGKENLPGQLSQHIERYIKSHNIYRSVSRNGKPDAATLVLAGKFTRLGRFKISIAVTLSDGATGQEVAYFRQTLWDILDTRDSISDLGREVADYISRIQYK